MSDVAHQWQQMSMECHVFIDSSIHIRLIIGVFCFAQPRFFITFRAVQLEYLEVVNSNLEILTL